MTTSGSTNINPSISRLIKKSMRIIQQLEDGEDLTPSEYVDHLESLTLMARSWQNEGIGLWKHTPCALFLGQDKQYYDLGPSGDHCASSYVKTEVSTAASSGGSSVDVDSITGITDGDYIGVELDGGDLQWTTVNGSPSGSTITLTDSLTDDVSVDNHVYAYTSLISRPVDIIEAKLHKDDDSDITVKTDLSYNDYQNISTKTSTGSCNQVHFERRMTNSRLWVWPTASDTKEYLKLTLKLPFDDFDSKTDTADFPPEALLALIWNLAIEIAPEYEVSPSKFIVSRALDYKQVLSDFDIDYSPVKFEVNK